MTKQSFVNFAGNDYLGLARHPALVKALTEAAEKYGISTTSSRSALGWTDLHQKLEDALAAFTGFEAACSLNTTYLGGPVYYQVMASRCHTVICDEMVHSNQYLGMKAAGMTLLPFKHLDVGDLERQLKGVTDPSGLIIATDGVYGISGEIAPAKEMARLAASCNAEFFMDDAHGFGVYGEKGRGVIELEEVNYPKTTLLASMSKSMGAHGGFIAGRKEIVESCRKSAITSGTAVLPSPLAGACLRALEILAHEPERRKTLFRNAQKMREILRGAGYGVASDISVILGILCKDEFEAARLSEYFLSFGLRIPYFKYASEPRHNLLRAVARTVYSDQDLETFAAAVKTFKRG